MKVVQFTSNHNGYGAGETAGWPDDYADALVKEGVAEHYDPKADPKAKAEKAKAKVEKADKAAEAKAAKAKIKAEKAKAKAEKAKAKAQAKAGAADNRETKPATAPVEK